MVREPSTTSSRTDNPTETAPAERLWNSFVEFASEGASFVPVLPRVIAPGGRVHLGNGDVTGFEGFRAHADSISPAFPDLVMEVEREIVMGDYLFLHMRMSAIAAAGSPIMLPGYRLAARGGLLTRANAQGQVTEMWSYLNPGFSFSFPASGHHAAAPAPDPGVGPDHARALYDRWVAVLRTGAPLDVAVERAMAPDGVVHLPNCDSGPASLIPELYARFRTGLPDYRTTLCDAIVHEDTLIVQFTAIGTHTGALGVYGPTGRVLPSIGVVVARADQNGRAAETWIYTGPAYAIPLPPAAAPAAPAAPEVREVREVRGARRVQG